MLLLATPANAGQRPIPAKKLLVASHPTTRENSLSQRQKITQGQAPFRSPTIPWEFGFLAGPNFSFASGDPPSPGNTRNTLSFSLIFEKRISSLFSLCPEIGYVQRGVHTQLYTFSTFQVGGDVKLEYLELPLLLKVSTPVDRKLRFFGTVGPNFGLAIRREVQVLGLVEMDLTNQFGQYDFSFILGGGAEYSFQDNLTFITTARYTFGLIDIEKTEARVYKTRSIQILFGLKMKL